MAPTNLAGFQPRSTSSTNAKMGNNLGVVPLAIIIAISTLILFLLTLFLVTYIYKRRRQKKQPTTSKDVTDFLVQPGSRKPLLSQHVEDERGANGYYPAYLSHSKTYPHSMDYESEDLLDRPSEIYASTTRDTRNSTNFDPVDIFHNSSTLPTLHYQNEPPQTPLRPVLSRLRISTTQQVPNCLPEMSGENAVLHTIVNKPESYKPFPSSPTSSSSLYSQTSQSAAESTPNTPPIAYIPPPLPSLTGNNLNELVVQQRETLFVGSLLKARANRNPEGLLRSSTKVSHIERIGSIKSVGSISEGHRSYARRHRSGRRKAFENSLEDLQSLPSRSNSAAYDDKTLSSATEVTDQYDWQPVLPLSIKPNPNPMAPAYQ